MKSIFQLAFMKKERIRNVDHCHPVFSLSYIREGNISKAKFQFALENRGDFQGKSSVFRLSRQNDNVLFYQFRNVLFWGC